MAKSKAQESEETSQAASELPPFLAMTAVYRDRLRMMKWWCVSVTVAAACLLGLQEARFHGVLGQLSNREVLVVPGAVDFMRVRPNLIPDSSIYYFAEYIAEQVGTFNFRTVEEKAARVGEFCTPQFRETYLAHLRKALPQYRDLQVSEVFNPKAPTRYVLNKDKSGTPQYVVAVDGLLERYSNDTRLLSEDEVIVVTFRTTRVQPDKPWFFEVVDISRKSRDEYAMEASTRQRLVTK
jgi:hypothetical protein